MCYYSVLLLVFNSGLQKLCKKKRLCQSQLRTHCAIPIQNTSVKDQEQEARFLFNPSQTGPAQGTLLHVTNVHTLPM